MCGRYRGGRGARWEYMGVGKEKMGVHETMFVYDASGKSALFHNSKTFADSPTRCLVLVFFLAGG